MPRTARELTPEELGTFRPWLRIAERAGDPAREDRRSQAWVAAREAAALLKERFGATRVRVFGSLLSEEAFTPWSDVDLAVSGLDSGLYYDAAGAVLDLGGSLGIKIDVIDLDGCSEAPRLTIPLWDAEGRERSHGDKCAAD